MVALPKPINHSWFRMGLFITLLAGVGVSLGRSLLFSKMGEPVAVPAITFPTKMPLPNWQSTGSQELQERSLKSIKQVVADTSTIAPGSLPVFMQIPVAGGRSYQYRQGTRTLQIEARYLSNTQGDVPILLAAHPSGDYLANHPTLTLQQHPDVGAYGTFTMQGKAYLSSCINPQGEATFTRQQFVRHHLRADLAPKHLWHWLLNQAEIPDRRCVWVYMWMADSLNSPPAQSLEATWLDWYREWRSQVVGDL